MATRHTHVHKKILYQTCHPSPRLVALKRSSQQQERADARRNPDARPGNNRDHQPRRISLRASFGKAPSASQKTLREKNQPQGGQAKTSNASQSHAREEKPIGTRAGKRKPAAQCPNSKAKDPGSSATNNEKNGISYKCNDGCATTPSNDSHAPFMALSALKPMLPQVVSDRISVLQLMVPEMVEGAISPINKQCNANENLIGI